MNTDRKTTHLPLLALAFALLLSGILIGCATPPPPTKSGSHLKLETITHDGQTAYSYRSVPN